MIKGKLSRDYFIFSAVVVAAVLFILSYMYYSFSSTQEHEKVRALTMQASQIERNLTEIFDYTNRVSVFMGKQIAEHGADDLKFIYHTFKTAVLGNNETKGLFSWSLYDWVDSNNLQLVNSKVGVNSNPPNMSHRDYTKLSPKNPWTLQMSKAAIGNPSGKWVIPAGTGVTDSKGKYLGAIIVGFNIEELQKTLEKTSSGGKVSFLILDNDFNIVVQSIDNKVRPDSSYYRDEFVDKEYFDSNEGKVSIEDRYGKILYGHYKKMDGYPYIILTGFNHEIISQEFQNKFIPSALQVAIFGICVLFLLHIYRKNIIEPISSLSQAADRISRGEKVKVPRSKVVETSTLSKQLINVMRYMNREKQHKKQLAKAKEEAEQAILIARESKAAKEEFLSKLRHELKTPLTTILGYSEVIMRQEFGKVPEKYRDIAENIFKGAYQMGTMMTSVLNKSEINTSKVLKECIALHKDRAYTNKVSYSSEIPEELPYIAVDEIRFRQIIVGVIHHSLILTPQNESVQISAKVKLDENAEPAELIFKVRDTGFGGNENFRKGLLDEAGPQGISRNTDGTDLTLDSIHSLLALHKGKMKITSNDESKKGSLFTICLPYSDKEDEISPEVATISNPDEKKNNKNSGNVIKFPGK